MNKLKKLTIIVCAVFCIAVVSNTQGSEEIVLKEIKPTLTGYTKMLS